MCQMDLKLHLMDRTLRLIKTITLLSICGSIKKASISDCFSSIESSFEDYNEMSLYTNVTLSSEKSISVNGHTYKYKVLRMESTATGSVLYKLDAYLDLNEPYDNDSNCYLSIGIYARDIELTENLIRTVLSIY